RTRSPSWAWARGPKRSCDGACRTGGSRWPSRRRRIRRTPRRTSGRGSRRGSTTIGAIGWPPSCRDDRRGGADHALLAGPPGFEPGLTDPESVGLPLPHGPVWSRDATRPLGGRNHLEIQEPVTGRGGEGEPLVSPGEQWGTLISTAEPRLATGSDGISSPSSHGC